MCENNENTVVPDDADEDIPFPGGPSSEAVSYTHLDVYKRQAADRQSSNRRSPANRRQDDAATRGPRRRSRGALQGYVLSLIHI